MSGVLIHFFDQILVDAELGKALLIGVSRRDLRKIFVLVAFLRTNASGQKFTKSPSDILPADFSL